MSLFHGLESIPLPRSKQYSTKLLSWYDQHRREFAWRDARRSPYQIWVSEVMLQQTGTASVTPYYQRFIARFPTVERLAAAELGEVLQHWAGLGYYARGRNLHRAAQVIMADYGGELPSHEAELRLLPGCGAYTAAAIAAIAFGRQAVVVDGNVERVLARFFAVEEPLPRAKPRLRQLAAEVTPPERCGDFAQAGFDLGATICRPRQPKCPLCPLAPDCQGLAMGQAESYPRKMPKMARPTRFGTLFWCEDQQGQLLLRHRPPSGLLGGMVEIPSSEWIGERLGERLDWRAGERPLNLPNQNWHETELTIHHVFTHFSLELSIVRATVTQPPATTEPPWFWARPEELPNLAFPTLFRKAIARIRP